LTLFNCQATDYSPLKNFTHLRTLFIEYSTISDLSVLAGLTKLKRLQLSENAITDFSPLKSIYPNLVEKDFELN
jgi:Leucine-rich repeat (LRR) protein